MQFHRLLRVRRTVAVTALAVMALAPLLWVEEACARAGDGHTGGSRSSSPGKPSQSPGEPGQSYSSPSSAWPAPGWGRLLRRLFLGGLIGSLLLGRGPSARIGLLEIMVLAGLIYLAFRYLHDRRPEPVAPLGYPSPGASGDGEGEASSGAVRQLPAEEPDRGIGAICRLDADFDPGRFAETASDIFLKVQAAWTARDPGRAADVLTPEMQAVFQKDCDRMLAERRINRLENVTVRAAKVSESWQERGRDHVTVQFLVSLIDYTTDEQGTEALDGNPLQPVTVEEFWTFVRPAGPNPWRLSAIQQPG